ncbi:DKNYY domain-containing protein [Arcobacter sp.]|uniref:DKNYY domain-containing protein n=1 Tax=Arcobacter sp. TaxID=1872629 RepID=UPI003C79458E
MKNFFLLLFLCFSIAKASPCLSFTGLFFGYTEGYEKDKNKVYFCSNTGYAKELEDLDINSFYILSRLFAKDKNKIYFRGNIHTFDPNSFKVISYNYSKDKDGVYNNLYRKISITHYDTKTFDVLSKDIVRDINGIYLDGIKIDVDMDTFKIIDSSYVLDKNGLYKVISKWNKNKTILYKTLYKKSKEYEKKYFKTNIDYKILKKREEFINFCMKDSIPKQFKMIQLALETKNDKTKIMNKKEICTKAAYYFASEYKTSEYSNSYNLDLSNKGIEDITALKYFNGIKELNLSNNPINNISYISTKKSIKTIKLLNTKLLNNIQALDKLTNLEIIEMSYGKKDLTKLKNLTNLKILSLSNLEIKSLCDFKNLKSLENLILNWNKNLKSFECVDNFKNLKKLTIQGSPISDLNPLIKSKSIEKLFIQDLPVSDISPLAKMEKLHKILFKKTKIKYLSSLKKSKSIETVYDLSENSIFEYFNRSLERCSPKNMEEIRYGKSCFDENGNLKPFWYRLLIL